MQSYEQLIEEALLAAPNHQLTQSEIATAIQQRYPYYRSLRTQVQKAISSNLRSARHAHKYKAISGTALWALNVTPLPAAAVTGVKRTAADAGLEGEAADGAEPQAKRSKELEGAASSSEGPFRLSASLQE